MRTYRIKWIAVEPSRSLATVIKDETVEHVDDEAAHAYAGYIAESEQRSRRKFGQGHKMQRVAYMLSPAAQTEDEAEPTPESSGD